MRPRRLILIALALSSLLVARPATPLAVAGRASLAVCAGCAFQTIPAAIAAARPGETIEVQGGIYAAPLVVDKPVDLEGVDQPILSAAEQGSVVHITAPDVTLRGFVVRDSGDSYDREDSGVLVDGARARILDNQVLNDLFGIGLRQSPDSLLQGNHLVGKPLDKPLRGDGLKVWYSPRTRIYDNRVENIRDCLLWYSDGSTVRGNVIVGGRYGFHFMQTSDSVVERNDIERNSVGIYLMYGKNLTIRNNLLRSNRGPSGDGIGVKEVDGAAVSDNLIVDNRVGIYVDDAPLSPEVTNTYRQNVLAYNDQGLALLPVDRGSVFTRNDLIDNVEQVAMLGDGAADGNAWSAAGQGNFWSDYAGYDGNGDGIGDLPYRARSLSEQLVDQQRLLQLFRFSLALGTVDLAGRAFPIFAAAPKLTDHAPLVAPVPVPNVPRPNERDSGTGPMAAAGLVLIGIVASFIWQRRTSTGRRLRSRAIGRMERVMGIQSENRPSRRPDNPRVQVEGLTKSYGGRPVLRDVSFSVGSGEALALWGPNGAGKTTILRCLLGLTRFDGEIRVGGLSPKTDGPALRGLVGYVPQELLTFDLEVSELADLIGRLRGVGPEEIAASLERFDLLSRASQPVPTLSGGMKQKLGLALALLGDPPILLLDEPTANLDEASQAALIEQLRALKATGRILVFTSHRWGEVLALADRIVRLSPTGPAETLTLAERAPTASSAPTLRVHLDPSELDRARALLAGNGYTARRNGTSVTVKVSPDRKAEPLLLLSQLGCPIVDFDLDDGQGPDSSGHSSEVRS